MNSDWISESPIDLLVFHNCIKQAICGRIHENSVWRIRINRELTDIFGKETIIGTIKRLRWAGHVIRMSDDRFEKKTFERNFDGTRKTSKKMVWNKMCRNWDSHDG